MPKKQIQKHREQRIRQPIVTLAGHVDHGKTSLLDKIRGTAIAKKEAGLITQAISCTVMPFDIIEKIASDLLKKFKIELVIPGFLFIDTPGHAAFTNLRKRGGSLADLVILVVDIREGMMEQTIECLGIFKEIKVPFLVALNKIDAIAGWQGKSKEFQKNLEEQPEHVKRDFDMKLYNFISQLSGHGFDSDLFFRVRDFTKQISIVPCSAKTGEGIPELLMMLAGLAQRFLKNKLAVEEEVRGTILETKFDKNLKYIEVVIYDGHLQEGDEIVIGNIEEPIVTKARALFEALPLAKGFEHTKEVTAASFARIQIPAKEEIFPGMPLFAGKKNLETVKKEIKKEISEIIKLDKEGIVIKADSLGSLEALIFLLRKAGIRVMKASIGNITRVDVMNAESSLEREPLNAVVLGFNVKVTEEVEEQVKVFTGNVIYKILEEYEKWREQREKELLRGKLAITMPCKIKVLPYVFRKNKPAIFGVRVEGGKLKVDTPMMNSAGKKIDTVKAIQSEGQNIVEAGRGKEVAISLPSITIGRQVREGDVLYSAISEDEFKTLQENKKYLSSDELSALHEILEIRRRKSPLWGV